MSVVTKGTVSASLAIVVAIVVVTESSLLLHMPDTKSKNRLLTAIRNTFTEIKNDVKKAVGKMSRNQNKKSRCAKRKAEKARIKDTERTITNLDYLDTVSVPEHTRNDEPQKDADSGVNTPPLEHSENHVAPKQNQILKPKENNPESIHHIPQTVDDDHEEERKKQAIFAARRAELELIVAKHEEAKKTAKLEAARQEKEHNAENFRHEAELQAEKQGLLGGATSGKALFDEMDLEAENIKMLPNRHPSSGRRSSKGSPRRVVSTAHSDIDFPTSFQSMVDLNFSSWNNALKQVVTTPASASESSSDNMENTAHSDTTTLSPPVIPSAMKEIDSQISEAEGQAITPIPVTGHASSQVDEDHSQNAQDAEEHDMEAHGDAAAVDSHGAQSTLDNEFEVESSSSSSYSKSTAGEQVEEQEDSDDTTLTLANGITGKNDLPKRATKIQDQGPIQETDVVEEISKTALHGNELPNVEHAPEETRPGDSDGQTFPANGDILEGHDNNGRVDNDSSTNEGKATAEAHKEHKEHKEEDGTHSAHSSTAISAAADSARNNALKTKAIKNSREMSSATAANLGTMTNSTAKLRAALQMIDLEAREHEQAAQNDLRAAQEQLRAARTLRAGRIAIMKTMGIDSAEPPRTQESAAGNSSATAPQESDSQAVVNVDLMLTLLGFVKGGEMPIGDAMESLQQMRGGNYGPM
ncbi:hypothetical protein NA57DRAFT_61252 [Rhizodiscina lignyota]|uniref:Uncharacterized protein n=1 Tax=Rhizodiscina lignyota TaxID=1504668 RepID=A0A9P4I5I3_9PEZI|nr:hypothetical protein NA57DRAFT_61252 [Rhizodiscina lignyota]